MNNKLIKMRQPFVDAMLKVFRETLVNSFEYLER